MHEKDKSKGEEKMEITPRNGIEIKDLNQGGIYHNGHYEKKTDFVAVITYDIKDVEKNYTVRATVKGYHQKVFEQPFFHGRYTFLEVELGNILYKLNFGKMNENGRLYQKPYWSSTICDVDDKLARKLFRIRKKFDDRACTALNEQD